jgi:NADH dehydrogenase FAD-containing subunit
MTSADRPRVVILGGGFGGLSAARALARVGVHVTLIDRHNYHLFQPLLYQVATAALAPNTIAAPVRAILRAQHNATVLMGNVTGIRGTPTRRSVSQTGSQPRPSDRATGPVTRRSRCVGRHLLHR